MRGRRLGVGSAAGEGEASPCPPRPAAKRQGQGPFTNPQPLPRQARSLPGLRSGQRCSWRRQADGCAPRSPLQGEDHPLPPRPAGKVAGCARQARQDGAAAPLHGAGDRRRPGRRCGAGAPGGSPDRKQGRLPAPLALELGAAQEHLHRAALSGHGTPIAAKQGSTDLGLQRRGVLRAERTSALENRESLIPTAAQRSERAIMPPSASCRAPPAGKAARDCAGQRPRPGAAAPGPRSRGPCDRCPPDTPLRPGRSLGEGRAERSCKRRLGRAPAQALQEKAPPSAAPGRPGGGSQHELRREFSA